MNGINSPVEWFLLLVAVVVMVTSVFLARHSIRTFRIALRERRPRLGKGGSPLALLFPSVGLFGIGVLFVYTVLYGVDGTVRI